ncbi:MAG: BrnT family toxin [Pseudomonas sp.]|uniref:BrnT family toxin n=1 Tax=Pseudomonas sp. TaxID=306 RepID=UPI003C73D1FD
MKTLRIQYDEEKNITNQQKHKGINLADAEPVFYDEAALTIQDHDHGEERWVSVGTDAKGRVLVVAYTYRDPNFVRIISARLASKNERRQYREG